MSTDVVECADQLIFAFHNDDRRADRRDVFGEVATDAGEFLDASDVEPGASEDRLALGCIELRRSGIAERNRSGAQIGFAPVQIEPGPVPKCATADQSDAAPEASHVRTRQ